MLDPTILLECTGVINVAKPRYPCRILKEKYNGQSWEYHFDELFIDRVAEFLCSASQCCVNEWYHELQPYFMKHFKIMLQIMFFLAIVQLSPYLLPSYALYFRLTNFYTEICWRITSPFAYMWCFYQLCWMMSVLCLERNPVFYMNACLRFSTRLWSYIRLTLPSQYGRYLNCSFHLSLIILMLVLLQQIFLQVIFLPFVSCIPSVFSHSECWQQSTSVHRVYVLFFFCNQMLRCASIPGWAHICFSCIPL